MEDCFLYDSTVLQVIDDYPLQQLVRYAGVPDPIGINHYYRTTRAHAEAGRLASLHPGWTEQEAFALEKHRQPRIQSAPAAIRGAEFARANKYMPGIRLHGRNGPSHVPKLSV